MTDELVGFVLFWGVWLFVPMLIDGTTAVAYFIGGYRSRPSTRVEARLKPLDRYPRVSILIPAYNASKVLPFCLESLRKQTYPHREMEVLIIDNQSTDDTRAVIAGQQSIRFAGSLNWISLPYKGKPGALNAGIHRVGGEIIINIDADTVLHPDSILEMVRAFDQNPKVAGATGSIEVLPADIDPRTGKRIEIHPFRYLVAEAEFLEYYAGFRIGRQYQSQTQSLFTLAGAFSAFRRDVLLKTFLYDERTVSEDTDLTFFIARQFPEKVVVAVAPAIAYVHPTESMKAMYAQRLRWQRGQLEVASQYPDFERHPFRLRGLAISKSLLIDHTLAFPRVVWTFLLPMMYFVGFPLTLVVSATLSMYLIYMVVEGLYLVVAYVVAEGSAKARIRRHWWMFLFMPAYRWTIFWFRFGGFLAVMMENKEWRASDPITETKQGIQRVSTLTLTFLTQSFLPRLAAIVGGVLRTK
ncbi:MAG: glycosyltransferase [Chloroflexi bacterium]|nr:glycosyltransferase [Chloroflexota bacterium]